MYNKKKKAHAYAKDTISDQWEDVYDEVWTIWNEKIRFFKEFLNNLHIGGGRIVLLWLKRDTEWDYSFL